ncbi:MAG: hypothetical protein OEU54_09280 [Gemmatimonadota bacterium]|nr:hypothetical protein [Gemmatimonadota bacterium]
MSEMSGVPIRNATGGLRAVAMTCCLSFLAAACGGWQDDGMPTELLGTWRTDAPHYADRGFTITPSTLTLHTGPKNSTLHPIIRTERDDDGDPIYTIVYGDQDQELHFSIIEGPDDGAGRWVHFPNQPTIRWRK